MDPLWWLGGILQLAAFGACRWTFKELRTFWRWLRSGPLGPLAVTVVVMAFLAIAGPKPPWRLRVAAYVSCALLLAACALHRRRRACVGSITH